MIERIFAYFPLRAADAIYNNFTNSLNDNRIMFLTSCGLCFTHHLRLRDENDIQSLGNQKMELVKIAVFNAALFYTIPKDKIGLLLNYGLVRFDIKWPKAQQDKMLNIGFLFCTSICFSYYQSFPDLSHLLKSLNFSDKTPPHTKDYDFVWDTKEKPVNNCEINFNDPEVQDKILNGILNEANTISGQSKKEQNPEGRKVLRNSQ